MFDEKGRVIGIYNALEARRKAETLKLDMILVNKKETPVSCKLTDFRNRTINQFYQEIVSKSQR